MTKAVLARLYDSVSGRPRSWRSPRRATLAAGLLIVLLGTPAVLAVAQGNAPELDPLPTPVNDELGKRLGQDLAFTVAVGRQGKLQPAPGLNVDARKVPPAGPNRPRGQIKQVVTITVIEYEKNPHNCYIYYHGGTEVEYCPRH